MNEKCVCNEEVNVRIRCTTTKFFKSKIFVETAGYYSDSLPHKCKCFMKQWHGKRIERCETAESILLGKKYLD